MDTSTFIRSVRIAAACRLMDKYPNMRVAEVALHVGYDNPKYFTLHFKSVTGQTPQQYKKS